MSIGTSISPEQFFQALSDQTRLRCLLLLQQRHELCVCELVETLRIAQPKISRHLAILRNSGIVLDRREGTWVHYRLNPSLPAWQLAVMAATVQGLRTTPPFCNDEQQHLNLDCST